MMARPWPRLSALILLLCLGAIAAADTQRSTGVLAEGTRWQTPYHAIDSGVDGPTVLVTGGIHGNEPAGTRAAEQIRHWPIVKGRLIVVPRANVPGLHAGKRHMPDVADEQRDLNRNFPDKADDAAQGELAQILWRFAQQQKPDWVLDLHEGYDFHISHEPPEGREKSVGSSVIYRKGADFDALARAMQQAANAHVSDPKRRFDLISSGPVRTGLVGACVRHLGARGMILETTYTAQPMSLRTRQHRAMVNVVLGYVGMIDRDCVDVMTPAASEQGEERASIALYDSDGTGGSGVRHLTRICDESESFTVHHVGPADMQPHVLKQFEAIVFPGGSGSRQAKAIGEQGQRALRAFVADGGGYLGICAGAYLCSSQYPWSLGLIDTAVLTGTRAIEGVGRKAMWYRGKGATVKMQLTDEGRRLFQDLPEHIELRYQNGPIVSPKNDAQLVRYTTLAHYRSEQALYPPQQGTMLNTPAIVASTFGKGRVISISPHPEATAGVESIIGASLAWIARGEAAPEREVAPPRPKTVTPN